MIVNKIIRKMRNTIGTLSMAAIILMTAACQAPKNVTYFQDAANLNGMALQAKEQFKLRPEDKINIIVNSSNSMLQQQFTLTAGNNSGGVLGGTVTPQTTAGRSSSGVQQLAYTVDEQGTIDFPVLGKIRVEGKTRSEVASYIKERLLARNLVNDAIITVEYVNIGVDVLGEVKNAGHIDITKDHFTVIDAISRAGDLTINGNRKNVMVVRHADGVNQTYFIDLTNMQETLHSPAYYLQQDDLVYVSPNNKRKREANTAGNTYNTPSFWISLVSLIATLATLVTK